uniref:40S ribosomal protein S3-3-like n=1 Tax=Tanacetum cinerariifolium TaxID=118510 RepID=A0A6L2JAL9_TANCI|nr:40S ribosomal protein S3-3-like [Tanacetum cinerariifolium]
MMVSDVHVYIGFSFNTLLTITATQLSKKQKIGTWCISFGTSSPLQFVADGVFFVKLNEVFMRELAEDGYSIVEVRVTPMRTEIIIRATRTQNILVEECFIELKEHVIPDKAYEWTVDELEHTAKALGYAAIKFLERFAQLLRPISCVNTFLIYALSLTVSTLPYARTLLSMVMRRANYCCMRKLQWSGNCAPHIVSVHLLNFVDKVFQLNQWGWLRVQLATVADEKVTKRYGYMALN